ncbi:hypothetical protein BKA70DRAFT_1401348 [Coprinopsis sp. MPI-PUGE-AT-0042]|nr:hypothetical protein BKA70DRAFT_1401348 [Coprinopsis sp. MPI-PUGE-AT-0042]
MESSIPGRAIYAGLIDTNLTPLHYGALSTYLSDIVSPTSEERSVLASSNDDVLSLLLQSLDDSEYGMVTVLQGNEHNGRRKEKDKPCVPRRYVEAGVTGLKGIAMWAMAGYVTSRRARKPFSSIRYQELCLLTKTAFIPLLNIHIHWQLEVIAARRSCLGVIGAMALAGAPSSASDASSPNSLIAHGSLHCPLNRSDNQLAIRHMNSAPISHTVSELLQRKVPSRLASRLTPVQRSVSHWRLYNIRLALALLEFPSLLLITQDLRSLRPWACNLLGV